MHLQQVIFFTLFITITYAAKIDFFDVDNHFSIHDNGVLLLANVTDCPPPTCSCKVQSNSTSDEAHSVQFDRETPNSGHALILQLQPDTLYSFTLSCAGTDETVTRLIQTDYGNPSAPQNITVILDSKRLRIFWLPPIVPAGPISYYRLAINRFLNFVDLPNNQLSYTMTEDYIYETEYTFYLQACNINRRNRTACSSELQGQTSFFMTQPTTPPSEISSKPNSSGILSYFAFFPIFIFYFLLFNPMKY